MAGDRIFGLVLSLVAAGYLFAASQIEAGFLSDPVGSKTFPYLIGGVALVCALVLIVRPDPDPDWPAPRTWLGLAIAAVVLVGYAYAIRPWGFLLPTAVASAILSYQIEGRPTFAVLSGIGLSVGLFVLFRYALGLSLVPFPRGLL